MHKHLACESYLFAGALFYTILLVKIKASQ